MNGAHNRFRGVGPPPPGGGGGDSHVLWCRVILPLFWIACSLNTFFSFGGNIYRQLMGIPMGIQPAPPIANLFLASYEFEFFQKLLAAAPWAPPPPRPPRQRRPPVQHGRLLPASRELLVAQAMRRSFRYIDDLGAIGKTPTSPAFSIWMTQSLAPSPRFRASTPIYPQPYSLEPTRCTLRCLPGLAPHVSGTGPATRVHPPPPPALCPSHQVWVIRQAGGPYVRGPPYVSLHPPLIQCGPGLQAEYFDWPGCQIGHALC